MTPSCQPTNICGTKATNWINGGHPSVADGQVSRTGCVSCTGLQVVVTFQQTSKLEIVVLIMCSILMAYLLVMAVIVVLIKNKESITCPLYFHSKWLSFFYVLKNTGWRTKLR